MNEFISLYVAESTKIPRPCEDTERFDLFTLEEISAMITSKTARMSDSFVRLFNKVSGKSHTIHGWDESEPL